MKKETEPSAFHVRSSQAVISAGYKLYMSNFRKMLRSSWLAALAYALCTGLLGSFTMSQIPQFTMALLGTGEAGTQAVSMAFLPMTALTLLLFVAATAVLLSYGYAACSEHAQTGAVSTAARWYGRIDKAMVWRTVKGTLWMMLFIFIAGMLTSICRVLLGRALSPLTALAASMLLSLFIVVLLLPLPYALTKYMLTPKVHFLKVVGPAFATGMRHLGSIFVVALVVAIITMLLSLVVQMPANILYVANMQSQLGTLQGDPAGMPERMGLLNFVVFTIMGFIQGYIHLSTIFPYYYLYGSIEKQKEERLNIEH